MISANSRFIDFILFATGYDLLLSKTFSPPWKPGLLYQNYAVIIVKWICITYNHCDNWKVLMLSALDASGSISALECFGSTMYFRTITTKINQSNTFVTQLLFLGDQISFNSSVQPSLVRTLTYFMSLVTLGSLSLCSYLEYIKHKSNIQHVQADISVFPEQL